MTTRINLVRAWAGESFRIRILSGAKRRLCVYVDQDNPRRIAVDPDLFDRLSEQGMTPAIEWWGVCMDRDTEEPSIMEMPDFLTFRIREINNSSVMVAGTLAHDLEIMVEGGRTPFYVRVAEETRVGEDSILMAQDILAGLEEDTLKTPSDVVQALGDDKPFVPECGWLGRGPHGIDWSEYRLVKERLAASGILSSPSSSDLFVSLVSEMALEGDASANRKPALILRAAREIQDDADSRQDA